MLSISTSFYESFAGDLIHERILVGFFWNWKILEKLEALVEIRIQEWHFLYKAIDDSWWTWLLTCSNFQVAEFGCF